MKLGRFSIGFAVAFCGALTLAVSPVPAEHKMAPGLFREHAQWGLTQGQVVVTLDPAALAAWGAQVSETQSAAAVVGEGSSFGMTLLDGAPSSSDGTILTSGEAIRVGLPGRGEPARIGNFQVSVSGRQVAVIDGMDLQRHLFTSAPETAVFDLNTTDGSVLIGAQLVISESMAVEVLENPAAAGAVIGHIEVTGEMILADHQVFDPPAGDVTPRAGADVIVGALAGDAGINANPNSYGSSGGIYAYSVGTHSCNIGTVPLQWIDGVPNQHPVIGQNMFRLKTEPGTNYKRFEQIGQAWLKYGFCALQQGLCGSCSPYCGGCCNHLGVGCSDPYTASRNGSWSNLGPKGPINAFLGTFPDPHQFASGTTTIRGRLQVAGDDVDPALNSGALYFVEGQYVANDDATAGNGLNNCSWRRVTVANNGTRSIAWVAGNATQQMQPAINAWAANDPGVTLVNVDVPSEGRFILGYKVSDNGDGTWHYEYALFNLNSDRSAQFFSVASPPCVGMTNIGFHDIFYHSGEVWDGTDWAPTVLSDQVVWSTQTHAQNPNANALRWATLYNFRFDAATPPTSGSIKIGLFKPGSPSLLSVTGQVPSELSCIKGDVSGNGIVDGGDVKKFVDILLGAPGTAVEKCSGDLQPIKNCEIDLNDVANFVDCVIAGGC